MRERIGLRRVRDRRVFARELLVGDGGTGHWTPTLAASLANSAAVLPPEWALFAPWDGPAPLMDGPSPGNAGRQSGGAAQQ
jgi:hypothetical protein